MGLGREETKEVRNHDSYNMTLQLLGSIGNTSPHKSQ